MALDKKTSEVKDHATYSASGAERWLNCPGSIKLAALAPEQPDSPYAIEGTEAHACLEFILKNRANFSAALKTAAKKWDSDMVEHAKSAAETILGWLGDTAGGELLVETRVDSTPFLGVEGQFGTLDVAIAQEFGRLRIIDYKYGAGHAVDPAGADGKGNPQLCYYGLGVSHLFDHNFSEVELIIIQPRAYHESGETVRSFTMPIDDLLTWRDTFKKGVGETLKSIPYLQAGSWCRYCAAATQCPELKDLSFKRAQIVFDDGKGLQSVPEPRMITLPNLSTILDACDRLEDWIGRVREHAVHVLERGSEIEGFKLVAKRGIRKWTDEETIGAEAKRKFGDVAFTAPKLLSPAQLEKTARTTPGIDEWVSARVTAESSGTTLVRATDKRQAVRTIENIFPDALQGKLPKAKK